MLKQYPDLLIGAVCVKNFKLFIREQCSIEKDFSLSMCILKFPKV